MHQIQLEQRRRPVYEALIDSSKQANKMMKEEAKTQQDRDEQVNEAKELTVGGQEAEPATPRSSSTTSCAGCRKPIRDKFIFSVIELHWHQDCVQCSDCSLKLNERCYTFEGKLYCKLDYWRRFGPKCFACGEPIGRSELVQRIKGNRVYHLKCFTCNCCQKQLEAGEQLHLVDDMRLMCKQDFSQFTRSCSSSASSSAAAAGVMRAAGAGLKSRYYTTLTSSRENRPADLKTLEAGEEGVPEEAADEEELEEEDEDDDDEGVDEDDDDEDDEDELYQQQPFGRLDSSNLENEENRSTFGDNKPDDKVQVSGNGGQVNPLIKQQKHHYLASSGKRKGRRRQRGQTNRKQLLRNNGESILSGLGGGQQPVLASPSTNQLMHLQANQQPAQQQKQVSSPGSIGRHSSSAGHKPTRVRTVLNEKQLALLRECYQHNPRPDALRKESLVEETGLSARVIRVWFQNKRCKDKKKSILYKQMQQNEKDGRHLTSLMRGVHLVASSPIQYDDHSTVSSTPGGGLPADPGNPRADNSSSPPQHYAVPRSPGGGQQGPPQQQPLDVHAYQPAWKSLAEYAQQQAAAGADRMNPHSPRYQQLLGQIHGFNSNEPPPTSQQLDPTERLQQQPASFVSQQQQQATQNAYPPQAHGSLMEHHAHHMIQPAPMGHLHQFPRHC